MPRLPKPGGDAGNWGEILNEFLSVEHTSDGKLNPSGTISLKYTKPEDGIPKSDLTQNLQDNIDKIPAHETTLTTIQQDGWVTRDRLAEDVKSGVHRSCLSKLGLVDPNPGIARLYPLPTVMDDPPTFAAPQKIGSTISNAQVIRFNDSRVRVIGSAPLIKAGPTFPNSYYLAPPSSVNGYAVEFMFDGADIEFSMKGLGPNSRYLVLVDGQLESDGYRGGADNGIGSDGALWFQKLTFGSRANRRITIWFTSSSAFIGDIYTSATDTVWLPHNPAGPTAVWIGDSFTEGTGAKDFVQCFTHIAGWLLGWNSISSGSGGTGYLQTTGAPFYRVKFRDRIQEDCINLNPDIVCICGGINDITNFTASEVQVEALALYQQIRAVLPNAIIVVSSPFWKNGDPVNQIVDIRDALLASWEQAGGDIFIDTLNGEVRTASGVVTTQGKWITGTGKVGATVGDGNADFYTTTDGTHPSPAGHLYYGQRFASAIAAVMSSLENT